MERERNSTHAGNVGWLAIAGFVIAFDRYSSESLTHAALRGLENPKCRPLVLGAISVTALHLAHAIPENYDPYYKWLDINRY